MKTKFRLQGILIGAIITAIILTGTALGATVVKNLEVTYRDIKLVIDGNLVTPKDAVGNVVEPFIYNGTTYLPVRAVAEAVGKSVDWDGDTSTVYLGGIIDYERVPKAIPLYHFPYIEIGDADCYKIEGDDTNNSIYIHSKEEKGRVDADNVFKCNYIYNSYAVYALNAKATQFTATVHPPSYDDWKPTLTYQIFGDGKLLYETTLFADTKPVDIDIDVTGVEQMTIAVECVSYVWNSFAPGIFARERGMHNATLVTTDY